MSNMNGDSNLYTTGEVAKLCGVSVRTVQYYDTRNILIPSELSEGGRRLYSEEDVKRMKIICFLREAGISINNIEELLSEEASEKVAIFKSANMSLGVNLLLKLLKEAAGALAPAGYDIEIIEKHHNLKKDAPSGTALALADSINEELDNRYEYVYDRSRRRESRNENEIGISAVRGGTLVGEHDVMFIGEDEVVMFRHTAHSKAILGKGAIQAAKFLAGKQPGLYNMQNVIEQ